MKTKCSFSVNLVLSFLYFIYDSLSQQEARVVKFRTECGELNQIWLKISSSTNLVHVTESYIILSFQMIHVTRLLDFPPLSPRFDYPCSPPAEAGRRK